jgi:hypothetical protein
MSAGERREGSGDPDDQNGQTDPADDDALSSVSPDSEAPPISPARRRLGILVALVFIVTIAIFLVMFILLGSDRSGGAGMLGG